jgi:hypothetical protein
MISHPQSGWNVDRYVYTTRTRVYSIVRVCMVAIYSQLQEASCS